MDQMMAVHKFGTRKNYLALNEALNEQHSQAIHQRPADRPKFSWRYRHLRKDTLQKPSDDAKAFSGKDQHSHVSLQRPSEDAKFPWCKQQCSQVTLQSPSDATKNCLWKEQHSQVSSTRPSDEAKIDSRKQPSKQVTLWRSSDDARMMTQGRNPLKKSKNQAAGNTPTAKEQNQTPRDRKPPIGPPKRIFNLYQCSFCKNNEKYKWTYTEHSLWNQRGNVVCPILRGYTCRQCGSSGDNAHTRKFCPMTHKTYTSTYSSASSAKPSRKEE